jgi:hypothetical protein
MYCTDMDPNIVFRKQGRGGGVVRWSLWILTGLTEDYKVSGICPCSPLEMTKLSSVFCLRFPDINIALKWQSCQASFFCVFPTLISLIHRKSSWQTHIQISLYAGTKCLFWHLRTFRTGCVASWTRRRLAMARAG